MKHKVPSLCTKKSNMDRNLNCIILLRSQNPPTSLRKKDRNLNSGKRTPLRATKKHHSCLKIGSYDVFCKPHTSLYTLYISIIARPTQTASTNTYQTRLLNILSATAKKQKLGGAKQSSQSGRHGSAITLNN